MTLDKLHNQKIFGKDSLLPYADRLDEESCTHLCDIKTNLGRAVLIRDLPSILFWTKHLRRYVMIYNFKFSKQDHIVFINILYELITSSELDYEVIIHLMPTLTALMRKQRFIIAEKDLVLDWRPLYKLYEKVTLRKVFFQRIFRLPDEITRAVKRLVYTCRYYFPMSETKNILRELKHHLCPFDVGTMSYGLDALCTFLPIPVGGKNANISYELWLAEFLNIWNGSSLNSGWDKYIIKLMSALAYYNIGCIDWEPYMPMIFNRILISLKLPVKYKKSGTVKVEELCSQASAMWIISILGGGSKGQDYLDQLLKTVESYCKPVNYGGWIDAIKKLLKSLSMNMLRRINRETKWSSNWENKIPDSHKLSDTDVTRFVKSMLNVALHALYTPHMKNELAHTFRDLARLRPEIVIPPLLERMYMVLDSVTDAYKLISTTLITAYMCRSMLDGGMNNSYKEGIVQVLPLFLGVLPAIDANDSMKSTVALQLIIVLALMVPIVDSSTECSMYEDITKEEELACSSTVQFEEFILQYFDRCLTLIEANALENNTELDREEWRNEVSILNGADLIFRNTMFQSTHFLLLRTTGVIFTAALKKVFNFSNSRIFERTVAAQDIAKMLRVFVKVNPEETFKLLIPSLCNYIDEVTQNSDIQHEENLEEEFLYKMIILSKVTLHGGNAIIPHLQRLIPILEKTLHLDCKRASKMACDMLSSILLCLFNCQLRSFRRRPAKDDQANTLGIKEWGRGIDYSDLEIDWYCPGENEIHHIEQLVWKFLVPELQIIDSFIENPDNLKRTELHKTLNILHSVLCIQYMFAPWDDEPIELSGMKTSFKPMLFYVGISRYIYMPDGSNIFKLVVEKLSVLQDIILQYKEDDVISLKILIKIWETMLPIVQKHVHNLAEKFINKQLKLCTGNTLAKKERDVPFVIVHKILSKHNSRVLLSQFIFTNSHRKIMMNLSSLAVYRYSQVRIKSQMVMFKTTKYFPMIALLFKDQVVENLKIDSSQYHDKFKGTLFLLNQFLLHFYIRNTGYSDIKDLFSAIVRSMPSEKMSIIMLIESFGNIVSATLPTKLFDVTISDSALLQAAQLWQTEHAQPNLPQPSEKEIRSGLRDLCERNKQNLADYRELMNSLLEAAENSNLHWRNLKLALDFMNSLVHIKEPYSARHIKFFLKTLIHESNDMRKVAVICAGNALKLHKRKFKKNLVDPFVVAGFEEKGAVEYNEIEIGHRADNQWLMYKSENEPISEAEWNKQRYIYSSFIGFYRWPKELYLYAPSNELESLDTALDEMTMVEKEVHNFFSNSENIDKIIEYYSLEQKNGNEAFRMSHYTLFRNLFRNFGDRYLEPFRNHLTNLVTQNNKTSQICAAEIVAGLVYGTKLWPYDKYQRMIKWLVPLINTAFSCATPETINDWSCCFTLALVKCDVNRCSSIIKTLTEDPMKEDTTYKDVGRILVITHLGFGLSMWRMPDVLHHLLEYVKPKLSHPYKQIRDTLGLLLVPLFSTDIEISGWNRTHGPLVLKFVAEYVVPQLEDLYKLSLRAGENINEESGVSPDQSSSEENVNNMEQKKKNSINFLRTICKWIHQSGQVGVTSLKSEFYLLLPILCYMEDYEKDPELNTLCKSAISTLATSALQPAYVSHALSAATEVSKSNSRHACVSCLEFLQTFVFYNLLTISNNDSLRTEVLNIIDRLLTDDRVEVRIQCGETISGLIHCGFIKEIEQFLKQFSRLSETPYKGKNRNLYLRHAGVLGLCAIIAASPYDVPDYIPDIFLQLNNHMSDPEPIPSTIRKTLSDFKRTHHSDWELFKKKFTAEHMTVFTDMVLPPTYYA